MNIILWALLGTVVVSSVLFFVLVSRLSYEEMDFWLRPMAFAVLCFNLIATGGALATGWVVSSKQGLEIEKTKRETAEAKQKQAEAEQLVFGIIRSLEPRRLPTVIYNGTPNFDGLKPFAEIKLVVETVPDSEPRRLAEDIIQFARAAGWTVLTPTPRENKDNPFFSGVTIKPYWNLSFDGKGVDDRKTREAGNALASVLNREGVRAINMPPMTGEVPPDTVWVKVGLRPSLLDEKARQILDEQTREGVKRAMDDLLKLDKDAQIPNPLKPK